MSFDFENPFADYGNIVHGERFIGRKDSLRVIENRIIRPRQPGNLAIIGEPRIGKSSLVYKAIIEKKETLIANKLLPIWINVGIFDDAQLFLQSLVTQCYDELEDLEWVLKPIERARERSLRNNLSWNDRYSYIQQFFQKVRVAGIQVLFILDEFDHARYLFKSNVSAFQGLRELSYRPEWRINYITISRRSIRHIELQVASISTFDGIFKKHYLGMFDESSIEEYFSRLDSIGLSVDEKIKQEIDFYCGGHPYLLEMLGYQIVEVFREQQQVDIDLATRRVEFLDPFDNLVRLLEEDGSLTKILQIVLGPVIDIKQTDIDRLLKYGLIKLNDKQLYVAFSQHFQAYLNLIEREIDLWPLWTRTEKALRQLITIKMLDKYGKDWVVKLEKAQQKLKPIFDACRNAQQKEQKAFGNRASQNLIDFTYPQDLFTIIFSNWKDVFQSIFGQDKNYWQQCASLLSKIRNPLAHNRDNVLYEADRTKAEGFCKEILAIINR